jgi:thiol-disulfide isomerase/thioredoxin
MLRAAFLALWLTAAPLLAGEPPPPAPGQTVPDFQLFDLQQVSHRLADYREPVLVINFWAFWCETWKAQLPQLRELARLQEELGFRLIVVSVDGRWAEVRRGGGVSRLGRDPALDWGFPVLLDGQRRLADTLGVRRVPTVMVVARRRVVWLRETYPGNTTVLRAVRRALSGQP